MSYEPRSRGIRSRRITTRKPHSREKKESQEAKFLYQEPIALAPEQVSSRIMNALEHLGNQRFALAPYSEHFDRWLKDIESVLRDFEDSLPHARTADYDQRVDALMSNVRTELNRRIDTEKTLTSELAEMQKRLAVNDIELSNLEREQRIKIHETKRGYANSMQKLQSEIDSLDQQRLRLLRKKPSLLERIFGTSKTSIEGNTSTLQSKKTTLAGKEKHLKKELDTLRSDYETRRKQTLEREKELREKVDALKATRLDDAVEIRRNACDQLRQIVSDSINHLTTQPKGEDTR
jgi:chromosome segregation ATPase